MNFAIMHIYLLITITFFLSMRKITNKLFIISKIIFDIEISNKTDLSKNILNDLSMIYIFKWLRNSSINFNY